ncbi:hypothetical protein JOC77_001008 [Peribacillus deserti]|uniref:Uncharacterized protein n=1 Tax=Peribacillus deserti TaxID=673318 RepID=A0ABS2QH56_9BACI|nr:hypothetical protein [Peribacillus deserti]MBM7691601.1 hypothetical protein [Peribacillus deserti]
MKVVKGFAITLLLMVPLMGCNTKSSNSSDKVSYTADLIGESENKIFTIADHVEGYYQSKDKMAYETHTFTVTWKKGTRPRDLSVYLNSYQMDGNSYKLNGNDSSNIDVKFYDNEAKGVKVLDYQFNKVHPTDMDHLKASIDIVDNGNIITDNVILTK